MPYSSQLTAFLLRFGAAYALLIAPWPGWNASYAGWIGNAAAALALKVGPNWEVRFHAIERTPTRPLNARLIVCNRNWAEPKGVKPAIAVDLDARGIGWIPTALFLAMVAATSWSWRRRLICGLIGLAMLVAFIAVSIGVDLISAAASHPELGLIHLGPFGNAICEAIDETLIVQLGASFVAPVVIWVALAAPAWFRNGVCATDPLRARDIVTRHRELV